MLPARSPSWLIRSVMANRRHVALVAIITALIAVLLVLMWTSGRALPTQRRLRVVAADGSLSPVFVLIARPQLVPDFNSDARMRTPGRHCAHRFYCRSDRLEPLSARSYWLRHQVESALYRLGFRNRLPKAALWESPCSTNTSFLWFGYTATNEVSVQHAWLISDRGERLALGLTYRQVRKNHSPPERIDCWEVPSLLPNRGTYRLVVPSLDRALVVFVQ